MFAAVCLGAMAAVPLTAGATPLPGENGRIVLTSEQNTGAQKAELFLLPVPFSSGGGALAARRSQPPQRCATATQLGRPTAPRSPTRAAPRRGPFDIWVQDLTQPLSGTNPIDLTSNAPHVERGSSPPGRLMGPTSRSRRTRGALPASRDIFVASAANGSGQTNLTEHRCSAIEGAPAWDPSGSTIYYEKGDAQIGTANVNIVKRSISYSNGTPTVGSETLAVADSGLPEIQPAISPDGQKICYGTGYPRDDAAPGHKGGAAQPTEQRDPDLDDRAELRLHLVARQHDGRLYRRDGSAGNLVMVAADGTSLFEIPLASGANIQTNPDWAPDARPECPDSTVPTSPNVPVTFQAVCTDTGPAYEQTNVLELRHEPNERHPDAGAGRGSLHVHAEPGLRRD